ncbi:hypothetical protein BGZ76_008658 [Entomortierella beljakovae]|nr:hypothetical protein BGZ76_008658 [Entomortierella beljakovae]
MVSQRKKENEDDLPALQFGVDFFSGIQIIQFHVAKERPEDHARVKLRVTIPSQYPNSLIINGTFVSIQGVSLAKAHIHNLRVETENGNIKLDNINRISDLQISIAQRGNVHVGITAKASGGMNLQARVVTNIGDIFMDILTPSHRIDLKDPTPQEHVIFAKAGEGQIFLNIRESNDALLDEYGIGQKKLSIEAITYTGEIHGHIDVVDKQYIYLDAESFNSDVIVNLSDNYSGKFSVGTIVGRTSVKDKVNSKDIITYQRFDREEKRGKKYSSGDSIPHLANSQIKVLSRKGSADVIFF